MSRPWLRYGEPPAEVETTGFERPPASTLSFEKAYPSPGKRDDTTLTSDQPDAVAGGRWAAGDNYGLRIPADPEALLAGGADLLTGLFRAFGALPASGSVSRIVSSSGFHAGGTGKKLLLTVAYDEPAPDLPEQLFVKFSRHFDNELWDSARFTSISEVDFAIASSSGDFPVPVPATLFADIEHASATGLIVSECITYGRNGVEPHHFKCMDYTMPDQVDHYRAIVEGLATLSGAHRCGRLSPALDRMFPHEPGRASRSLATPVPEATVLRRAQRLIDFVERHPRLFPANVRAPAFHQQFLRDVPDVVAAADRVQAILQGNPDFIAFGHWNANIDNCWFTRTPDGRLRCGFLDWANAGPLSVAQSISGAISGAERVVWDDHLDELLGAFVDTYAASGGPRLDLDELRLHTLLLAASSMPYSMGAPIALPREIEDIDALESGQDPQLVEHENARIQLHQATRLLNLWQTRSLGDVVRAI